MPVPANLVHETSTSTGTGTFTVAAINGKQRFSTAFGSGATPDVFDYFISNRDGAEWERGTGHMSAASTLVRDTVLESSNSNSPVSFSVGTKDVANDVPAAKQLRVEAQALSAGDQEQVRTNVYAAPFDALAFSGVPVNGSMESSQENGSSAVLISSGQNKMAVDNWRVASVGGAVLSAQQVTDAPAGYNNSLRITISTADASLAASDMNQIYCPIEGLRVSKLWFGNASASAVTIGIWMKCSLAGTIPIAISNGAGNRSYVTTITIIAVNTWEFKAVTIPGDTTGAWAKADNVGMYLTIGLGSGSNFQTTAGSWSAGNFFATSGSTNVAGTASATFQITGVVVLPGIELPSSDRARFLMRDVNIEEFEYQRYYNKTFLRGTNPAAGVIINPVYSVQVGGASTSQYLPTFYRWPRPMRASPTMTLYNPVNGNNQIFNSSTSSDWSSSFTTGSTNGANYGGVSPAATGAGWTAIVHIVADARLT